MEHVWLVVSTPLKNMSSSVGIIIPNRWGKKNVNHQPDKTSWNHQPAWYFCLKIEYLIPNQPDFFHMSIATPSTPLCASGARRGACWSCAPRAWRWVRVDGSRPTPPPLRWRPGEFAMGKGGKSPGKSWKIPGKSWKNIGKWWENHGLNTKWSKRSMKWLHPWIWTRDLLSSLSHRRCHLLPILKPHARTRHRKLNQSLLPFLGLFFRQSECVWKWHIFTKWLFQQKVMVNQRIWRYLIFRQTHLYSVTHPQKLKFPCGNKDK